MFFRRNLAPAQRAVGDCPPLKESPGRVPAAGEIFFILVININDFFTGIIIILVFIDVFSNRISMIMHHVNCKNMKKYQTFSRISISIKCFDDKNFHNKIEK